MPDTGRVAGILAEAAAEEVMPRFRNLASGDVHEKSPGELVTAADEAMERRLAPALRALIPGSMVVGEEGAAADPAVLSLLEGDEPVWLVDPLDGTANFAAGLPGFGVMVCLVVRAEPVAAGIHDPMSKGTLMAEAGSGAWLDGVRIRLKPAVRDPLTASISTRFFPAGLREAWEAASSTFENRGPSRCAARTYLELATGELDVAMYYRLLPWDHAPGVLIHREAGGFATRLNGQPYSPLVHSGGVFAGPDEEVWRRIAPLFEGLPTP